MVYLLFLEGVKQVVSCNQVFSSGIEEAAVYLVWFMVFDISTNNFMNKGQRKSALNDNNDLQYKKPT